MKAEAAEVKRLNVVEKGEGVAILAVGDFLELGRQAAAKLKEKGIHATVAAVRCVSEPDEAALAELAKTHKVAVTLEDGVFGRRVRRESRAVLSAQSRLKCWHTAAERNLPTASRWTRFTAKTGWNRK